LGSLVCKKLSYNTSAKRRGLNKITKFEIWNSNLTIFYVQSKLARISFKLSKYIASHCLGTVAATVTLGCHTAVSNTRRRDGWWLTWVGWILDWRRPDRGGAGQIWGRRWPKVEEDNHELHLQHGEEERWPCALVSCHHPPRVQQQSLCHP
jgi:hypothetical protein